MNREEIINILINRDGLTREEAQELCEETIELMMEDPLNAEDIMMDQLGLEPDYIIDLIG